MKQPEGQEFCECGGALRFFVTPIPGKLYSVFANLNLGGGDEFWQCQRCGKKVAVEKMPRQEKENE